MRLHGPAPPLGAAAAWFAVIGAAVGALAGAVAYLAAPQVGAYIAAILAVAVLVAVTGALHADGLADCADALGVRGDRARRLGVMREPAIGTFGALALLLWAMLLVAALARLDRGDALRALIVAAAVGRWAALVHAAITTPARADGLGMGFAPRAPALAIASLTAAACALALTGIVHGVVVLVLAALVAVLIAGWARAALGGRTGDTLGATVALAEVTVLVALLWLS